jgi:cell wall-associated NlpC family hydrolase
VANRAARHARPLVAIVALGASLAVAPTLAEASPGTAPHAKPTISSVQKQLRDLARKNSQLVERFDQAQVLVQRRQDAAERAAGDAARAADAYRATHQRFVTLVQAQYESGGFGAAGALLISSSDDNYLDRLETLDVASKHVAQVVEDDAAARTAATAAARRATKLLAEAKHQRTEVTQARSAVRTQIAKYRSLLAKLNAEQRAALARQINPTVSPHRAAQVHVPKATPAAAKRAVEFALAQVGKPYVYGAAGPGSYDCSGLTMASWQQGGISLPHSAAEQYNYGHHVARDALQPGDLLFYYQPIGHVTIYIGNGLMVSAPTEGQPVSVVSVSAADGDYVGATRLT